MLPERRKAVSALSAGPENACKHKDRTDEVANASHALIVSAAVPERSNHMIRFMPDLGPAEAVHGAQR